MCTLFVYSNFEVCYFLVPLLMAAWYYVGMV
jgi:hypothetical protein